MHPKYTGIQKWLPTWRKRNFILSTGQPVKNAGLIKFLAALLDERARLGQKVTMEHVYGHRGEAGNEAADALANRGAALPAVRGEQDWEDLARQVREGGLVRVLSGDALADALPSPSKSKRPRLSAELEQSTSEVPSASTRAPPPALRAGRTSEPSSNTFTAPNNTITPEEWLVSHPTFLL